MKWLKLIGLGFMLWGLSLIWPEINLTFTPTLMWALVWGLAFVSLVYILIQSLGQQVDNSHPQKQPDLRPKHSSRPISVTSA